jgi:flagellar assembly protein FliH
LSNRIISKEKLGAYQRWELDSFDEPLTPAPQSGMVEQEVSHLAWPTAEEIEQIQQRSHEEGMAAGRDEGYKAGYSEGREQSLAELGRLKQLMASLDEALAQFDQELGEDMLGLSLSIAKQVTRNALKFRPEALLPVIREAISSMPQPNHHAQLILHPNDAVLVRPLIEEDLSHFHCRIVEDSHIERGGCRVKTEASEVDATLQGRWNKVVATLGRNDDWLD